MTVKLIRPCSKAQPCYDARPTDNPTFVSIKLAYITTYYLFVGTGDT